MKISDLDLYVVDVPAAHPEGPVRALLVRISSDSGLEGWGEMHDVAHPDSWAGRAPVLQRLLAGFSPFNLEELHELEELQAPPLRAAIEMACWDLVGRACGQPLCHLWGGVYRDHVALAAELPAVAPELVPRLARELAEQGFHALRVELSGKLAEDLELVRAVREASAGRATLRLDGCRLMSMNAARELCQELEAAPPEFLLDPLTHAGFDYTARLGRQTVVPLALRRAVSAPHDVQNALRVSAGQFVVLDHERLGGLLPARKCAQVAASGGLRSVLESPPALGVATAAMLHLATCTPNIDTPCQTDYHRLQDDVLCEPLAIVDGTLAVPRGPGLGVRVNLDQVERYQVA